jgi:hypothetical protein
MDRFPHLLNLHDIAISDRPDLNGPLEVAERGKPLECFYRVPDVVGMGTTFQITMIGHVKIYIRFL